VLVRVYLKNSDVKWFDVNLAHGVQLSVASNESGIVFGSILTIGENEHGPVFVREEDLTAIVPRSGGGS
jgi:hypothetical protein